ncbi:MAG TPA: hypothetical protein EYH55_00485 [Methanothermococcus okinawensis]|uniref:Uncharacterized protein n=1 Tax=Methanothermococcus okinawensis TaxID=155863 RepID=A0A832ZXI0_9EURY|nr:hypothetical protein [Methanothermococcus okinawensis]
MIEVRGKSPQEIIEKLKNMDLGDEKEIYINTELSKDLIIYLLENTNINTIYLPPSKYRRTKKKLIEALKEIGLTVKPLKVRVGRPSKVREIVAKYMDKKPWEIAQITGLNIKTVEYHYYKLRKEMKEKEQKDLTL